MELAPSGAVLTFEVTYDSPSLFVGMLVYNDNGPTPVLVQGPTPMTHVVNNTYRAKFTAAGGSYIIVKAVYTDNTYTVIDSNYSQGSESIIAESFEAGSASGCAIVGYVNLTQSIVGYVNCD